MDISPVASDRAPRPLANYSQGVRVGEYVFLAGQIASDYVTGIPPEASAFPESPAHGSDIRGQTRYVLDNIGAVLAASGSSFNRVIRAQVFLQDIADLEGFDQVYADYFGQAPPTRTVVQVGECGLLVPGCRVEIDFVALAGESGIEQRAIRLAGLPPAGMASPANRAGDLIFASGQMACDATGRVPPAARIHPSFPYYGAEVESQTTYILENLRRILEEAGSSLDGVVKAQVFLVDLAHFSQFDDVWKQYLRVPPARTTVQVARLPVPGCLVAVDVIAVAQDRFKKVVATDRAPRPLANYSQAIAANSFVFLAGQLASDFRTGVPAEARVDPHFPWYGSDITRQTEYILSNCDAVLREAGSSLEKVVKAQVFLTDLSKFYEFDKVWKRFFHAPPPRTTVRTAGHGLLVPGCLVEIDLIAVEG